MRVSIPSSRVGTASHRLGESRKQLFPSPQVGSGRRGKQNVGDGSSEFPSPQVGSGLPQSVVQQIRRARFHPLKSGRDYNIPFLVTNQKIVSIPSSRVGTGGWRRR